MRKYLRALIDSIRHLFHRLDLRSKPTCVLDFWLEVSQLAANRVKISPIIIVFKLFFRHINLRESKVLSVET